VWKEISQSKGAEKSHAGEVGIVRLEGEGRELEELN
jgi:hypothetical protein